ncbi:hypothetical protein EOD39_10614 [Acipenser ruthenus]|uniref:Peptidase A2 domain-containing protein n=1 Tax=Acipenser ruthenus TaxID=7906 RepID=A0A662YUV5_ACIRT|nr:hypothetical protein EOD39_10614 [Acipenser ruthenus]
MSVRGEIGKLGPLGTAPAFAHPVRHTSTGEYCHIAIGIGGVLCIALLDTRSTVTLFHPDLLAEEATLEATMVQLSTVTGEEAPLLGKSRLVIEVAGRTFYHPVWLAEVQEQCILGLDFLRFAGGQLDLQSGRVSFKDGPPVGLRAPGPAFPGSTPPAYPWPGRRVLGRGLRLVFAPSPPPCLPPSWTPAMSALFPPKTANVPHHQAAIRPGRTGGPPPSPLATLSGSAYPVSFSVYYPVSSPDPSPHTTRRSALDDPATAATRTVWKRCCEGLQPAQRRQLWDLLHEFRHVAGRGRGDPPVPVDSFTFVKTWLETYWKQIGLNDLTLS